MARKVYGFVFSLPLLISTAYYIISSSVQIPDIDGQTALNKVLSNVSSSAISRNGTEIPETKSAKNETSFLMNLTSGDRSIYERKASWWFVEWGDRVIPIYGNITNIPFNKTDLDNKIVMIQAYQNDKLIYEKFVKTGINGNFTTFFYPPDDGTVKVIAKLNGENSTARGLITIIATQAWAPAILIAFFISLAILSIVLSWHFYQTRLTTGKNPVKQVKYLKWGILPTVVATLLSYMMLYKFPPFDAAGNAVIATGLIAPIAAYIFETVKESKTE